MLNALRSAATGMGAQQTRIDGIANDLANINTVGFKRARPEFEDLYYDQIKSPGVQNTETQRSPNGIQIGHGTKLTAMSKLFTQGEAEATSQPLDVAIAGEGFFIFIDPNGQEVYSRNGVFQLNENRELVNTHGLLLQPGLTLPEETTSVTIGVDGTMSVKTAENGEAEEVGQIELAMFQNPAGLEYLGANLYRLTDASGPASRVEPNQEGAGKLQQGFLESSNVNIGESLINMVVAQRSYESNAKVIETADRMMQSVNNIL